MPFDTTPTTPTTLLEAINALLSAARVSGITSLEAINRNEDAASAKIAIDGVIREALGTGYEFNTERGVVIDPDEDGTVFLPANTQKVRTTRWSSPTRLVQRGNRLYDPTKRSYEIGESVTVDLVVALEFDELPPTARFYVTAVAARRFALPKLPDGSTFRYTEEAVASALAAMEHEDSEVADTTLPETSPHFAKMSRR